MRVINLFFENNRIISKLLFLLKISIASNSNSFLLPNTVNSKNCTDSDEFISGLFDVATPMGLPEHDEDFGQTLAVWGIDEAVQRTMTWYQNQAQGVSPLTLCERDIKDYEVDIEEKIQKDL